MPINIRAILLSVALCAAVSAQDRKPNFIILLADDLGYCDTGLYGCEDIPTPHINSIAEDGALFTDGYVTAGTCSPSRAALLTGRYQQRFGFEFNTGSAKVTFDEKRGLPTSQETIADRLKPEGYRTGLIGKWHQGIVDGYHPHERGFDEFFGFLPGARAYFDAPSEKMRVKPADPKAGSSRSTGLNVLYRGREKHIEKEYLTDAFAREASDFIERNKENPFFLYVAFNAPHTPIEATRKYVDRFADQPDELRRVYQAMVSALDDAVGEILATLENNGLAEDTMVVFLSDNGCATYTDACTNDPLRLGKTYLFEGGVRIPFALRFPRALDGGAKYTEAVSSLDLLPTFLAAAGADLPGAYDGTDLLPFLTGKLSGAPHEMLCWRNGDNRAIRQGNWKMFWNDNSVWLFDLAGDLGERSNVAREKADIVKQLKQAYGDWEKANASPAWPARPGRTIKIDGVDVNVNI